MQKKYKKLDTKINKLSLTQTKTPRHTRNFFPRVVNDTNIPFTEQEMALLHKGLKYNLHAKQTNWLENLALEAETAVSQMPPSERDVYRKLVAERISNLHQNNNHPPTRKEQHEANTIRSIRSKIKSNNATVTRADKGNTLVIAQHKQTDPNSTWRNLKQPNQSQSNLP